MNKVENQFSAGVEQIISELPERCRTCPGAQFNAISLEWLVELQRISHAQAAA